MKLNVKQSQALDFLEDNVTTELLYGGGAGGGKSILGCYWLAKMALKYDESRWVMSRANMKVLKETTYLSFLKVAAIQKLKAETHFTVTSAQHKEYPNCILFPNRSVILMKDLDFYPSDPEFDELGSLEITGGFIDEANQVTSKAKQVLQSRMRHNISRYGIVPKLLMTCNPAKNWVYTDFYKPFREKTLKPYQKFIQALVDDNPDIDPSYKENLLKLDKNSKERLLKGNWEYDDDPAALINYEKIMDCYTNTFVAKGPKYITVDVARFGSDKTVIGLWEGYRVRLISFKGLGVTEVADKVKQFQTSFGVSVSNTLVDEDGVGGGVVDILRCKGFINNSRPLPNPITKKDENYNNLKSQCYFRLADRINSGGLYIEVEDSDVRTLVTQELEQVKQYQMDKDGKKQIMPKDKVKELIGRSPDFSDTLMMREWFDLTPQIDMNLFLRLNN